MKGYFAIPRELWAALRPLPRDYGWLMFELLHDAQWEPKIVEVRGTPILLDVGESLISIDGLARRIMGDVNDAAVGKVRRGLATLERLGFISRRPAGTPPGTPPVLGSGTQTGTPPSLVRVEKWREICWQPKKADTQTSTAPGTRPGSQPGRILPAVPDQPDEQENEKSVPASGKQTPGSAIPSAHFLPGGKSKSCRKAVSEWFEQEFQSRAGRRFAWSAAERTGIARLSTECQDDQVEAIGLLKEFIRRVDAGEDFYASNFRPSYIASQVNTLRLPWRPRDGSTTRTRARAALTPASTAQEFAAAAAAARGRS